ncbi:metallophosphoesterase family protein [Microvirga thermotolerans]|uniref:Metallophosphoesterase n=1 Tax=Microvirga thermotolerans TaxID=2651334 RepID=A0A5P9JYI2_9HYPH|nr:metallophosphoesterase [Microvirga thermotolerans]QFU17309.1 metallophosphoesterase [Microvirga thermotolerans]
MFRLAHLTDPHVGPLPRPQLRQLLSKRLTGWYNWHRSRSATHDMELLAALVSDIRAQAPNHIACTGDTCNIGLPSEWTTSRIFLESLGSPETVSFVPGNHDAYVMGALEGLLKEVAPWTRGIDGREGVFPFLRRFGPVALVGLSSAIPTLPFVASGRVGSRQMKAAERILAELGQDPACFRIVLIHHPPHRGGAQPGRNLTDASAFEAMIRRVGAELVLHGHNHVGSLAHLPGPRGPVPVVGAPSASARSGTMTHKAGYHLFTIDRDETGFLLTAELRGLQPDGTIGGMGMLSLGQIRRGGGGS